MPIDNDKLYEEIGQNWRHYVSWREKIFAGYLTALAALAFAFSQNKSPAVLSLVFAFGLVVSLVFRILDFRTTELVNLCQLAGDTFAGSKGFYNELNQTRFDKKKSTSEQEDNRFRSILRKLCIFGPHYALAINVLVAWVGSVSLVGCIVEWWRYQNKFVLGGLGLAVAVVCSLFFKYLQDETHRAWLREKNKYEEVTATSSSYGTEEEAQMTADRYAVVKLKGVEPETFRISWEDSALPKGAILNTAQNLTEGTVRAALSNRGFAEADIDSLIAKARQDPK